MAAMEPFLETALAICAAATVFSIFWWLACCDAMPSTAMLFLLCKPSSVMLPLFCSPLGKA